MKIKYVFYALLYVAILIITPYGCALQFHYTQKFQDYLEQKK